MNTTLFHWRFEPRRSLSSLEVCYVVCRCLSHLLSHRPHTPGILPLFNTSSPPVPQLIFFLTTCIIDDPPPPLLHLPSYIYIFFQHRYATCPTPLTMSPNQLSFPQSLEDVSSCLFLTHPAFPPSSPPPFADETSFPNPAAAPPPAECEQIILPPWLVGEQTIRARGLDT